MVLVAVYFYFDSKSYTMGHLADPKDILLAEDDADDALFFELAMDELKLPYELRVAVDGHMLFILLKDKLPYILFLDIEMPCKDGIACIAEIRKNPAYDKLPVVMYSGYSLNRYKEASFRNQANFYIAKANSVKEIAASLAKVFAIDWSNYMHYPPYDQFFLS